MELGLGFQLIEQVLFLFLTVVGVYALYVVVTRWWAGLSRAKSEFEKGKKDD